MSMTEIEVQLGVGYSGPHQISGKTVLLATLAGVLVGGPLLGMMGFSFMATVALFLIASPLLIICSPLLFGAAFVFLAALVGLGAAAATAIAGLSAFGWGFRSFRGMNVKDKWTTETEVKEERTTGKDWGGYLPQNTVQGPPESRVNHLAA